MNEWIEERCEALRLALRIPGFPASRDIYRLTDWLGANVNLRHAAVACSYTRHERTRATVTLPARLMGRAMDAALAHELGHSLLTMGMGALLRQDPDPDVRTERLARLWDAQDERRAEEFVAAWYMPSSLVAQYPDDEDLAELSGCSGGLVQARRQSLAGQVVTLKGAPQWSAARMYHPVLDGTHTAPQLYVVALGGRDPLFLIPVTPAEAEASAMQLQADLLALTVQEFGTRYGEWRRADPRPMRVSIQALQAWARGA